MFKGWDKTHRGSKGMEASKRHEKESKKKKKLESIQDAYYRIGGSSSTYIYKTKRDDTDYEKGFVLDEVPSDYLRLDHGKVAIQDEDTGEIVLMVQFTQFSDMGEQKCEEFEELAKAFFRLSRQSGPIKNNSAHQGEDGKMYAMGWRGDYNGRGIGRYYPSASTQRSSTSLTDWEEDQTEIVPWIGDLYHKRFKDRASTIFEGVCDQK